MVGPMDVMDNLSVAVMAVLLVAVMVDLLVGMDSKSGL